MEKSYGKRRSKQSLASLVLPSNCLRLCRLSFAVASAPSLGLHNLHHQDRVHKKTRVIIDVGVKLATCRLIQDNGHNDSSRLQGSTAP